ncbi:ubiquitin-like-specific protease 1 [Exaiptasia diaphana]|uniref:Ubiquitin-like protease family profile domain-containing protein n=1 Tax=Exaiptasia diaphana TaxID=2652724 RepID=A0A913YUD8_EXADI|nr:ubiquitin-like-specific protease 1 [Exaiptasia diaphana]
MDSLSGCPDHEIVQESMEFMKYAHLAERGYALEVDEWVSINLKGYPRQTNDYDCGVFVCKFAQYVNLKTSFDFDQLDMQLLTTLMIKEIFTGSLLDL